MSHNLFSKSSLIAALLCVTGLLAPLSAYAADTDGDGFDDLTVDNCPGLYNPSQKDWDNDGLGDLCDPDDDNDGYADDVDAFPRNAAEWIDTDGDGIGNNADLDDDNDGYLDTEDLFPLDGRYWHDQDNDGVPNQIDNCPIIPNPDQANRNGNSKGDACDNDNDSDGIPDDVDDDDDNDGINDYLPNSTTPDDNCHWIKNADQNDLDGDNIGDACDDDRDGDGKSNSTDAFPDDPAEWLDSDGDGIGDNADKFPNDPTESADNDSDGVGDNRDPDDDNDGIPDRIEIKYSVAPYNLDPLVADSNADADSDTFTNLAEYYAGSSPIDVNDTPVSQKRQPAQFKMVTKLGVSGDSFGSSMAVLGNTAIIGAPNGQRSTSYRGGAYIFTTADSGVTWQQNLSVNFTPTSSAQARLGKAVAIANGGNHILLSADGNNNAGAVYLYDTSGNPLQTLTAADSGSASHSGQGFGNSIAVSGDTALISAPGTRLNASGGSAAGAVYVYVRNGNQWDYQATLRGSDTAAQHFFGSSIALEGDRAAIGASGVNVNDRDLSAPVSGANTGKVYVYERSGSIWNLTTIATATKGPGIQSSDTRGSHYFGSSVTLNGNTLVVGASGVSDSGANSGAAYIFTLSGGIWSQQTKLTTPDAAAQLFFGYRALMTDSNTVMIATPWASSRTTSNSGGIYIYRLITGTWTYNGKLQSHDRQSGDYFGNSLTYSASINRLLVGAPGVDDDGDGAGAAYAFNLTGIDADNETDVIGITGDTIADLFDNCPTVSNKDQADLDGDGIGNVCDDDIDGDGHNNGPDILLTYPAVQYPGLISNGDDLFSLDPSEWFDTDSDGMGDNIDPDADDDGIPDRIEVTLGLNPLDPTDAALDPDGDSSSNLNEYIAGTHINDINDYPSKLSASYTKLITNDGALNDIFGSSIAIYNDEATSRNYAIVGAPGATLTTKSGNVTTYYNNSGAAYIYELASGNWSQKIKLEPYAFDNTTREPASLARFGSSVAIHGDYAIVGAPGVSDGVYSNAGAAYLFHRDGGVWTQAAKLTATAPGTNHYFGSSVAFDSNAAINTTPRLVIGAPGAHKNSFLPNTGAAYLFEFNGNWQQTKLIGFDSKGNDAFGTSVALAGDQVMVGAPYADAKNYAAGAIYRFRRDSNGNWLEKSRVVASDGQNGDQFGSSIALVSKEETVNGQQTLFGVVVIGAPGSDGKGSNSGAAYIFDYTPTTNLNSDPAWVQQKKLEAIDGAKSDTLGKSVALTFSVDGTTGKRSSTVVVGAKYHDSKNNDSGAVYLFTQAPDKLWVQQRPMAPNNGKSYDYFGSSVAIDTRKRVLIGASGVDDNDIEAGAAFVVTYDDTDNPNETPAPDGVYDSFDNCPNIANEDQINTDQNLTKGDGLGDACDDDDDGDGVLDINDAFPLDPKEQIDTDGDGIGDEADLDDDGDGIPDTFEETIGSGLDPKDPSDAAKDNDGDGLTNLEEFTGVTYHNNPDSDGDGATDGEERDYGTPLRTPDEIYANLDKNRPVKPIIKPIVSPLLLSARSFDSYVFADKGDNDPDDGKTDYLTQSEWQINTTQTFAKEGRVLRRVLSGATSAATEEKARKLTIADGILMAGEHYWIRTRHYDGVYWSEWSNPVEITMTTEGDHYATNGIDDRYFVEVGFDADGDGDPHSNDTEKSIISIRNAGNSSIIGVQPSRGAFKQLSAIPYSELPTTLTENGRMPYGLFSFRIVGLDSSNEEEPDHVTVTFYFPEVPAANTLWYKYNSTNNTLENMGSKAAFLEKRVSVTLVDGGEFDADGVVNGVIVDPSGLYIPITDEERLSDYKTGAFSPLALLGLLLCWPLRRLTAKRRVA